MKTNDHNNQLFRDMQEEPDKYSDQEIEAMMDDLDQVPDVDEAWQQFTRQHNHPVRLVHTWRKVAAILIGVLTLSGIAIAAIHIVRRSQHYEQPSVTVDNAQYVSIESNAKAIPMDTVYKTEAIVFDNISLDSIARNIAAYHHLDLEMQNEQANELRFYFVWNQGESLQEVIEKLNMFDQVHLAVEDRKLYVR